MNCACWWLKSPCCVVLAAGLAVTLGCTGLLHGAEGIAAGECGDGADNDGDGTFDCSDSDCAAAPDCADPEADDTADDDGPGATADARLFADVYTWQCEDRSGGNTTYYEGIFSYEVALEHAPGSLRQRDLPASGCSSGLDLFPADAGDGGANISGVDAPKWSNGDLSGTLRRQSDGFYSDDAYGDVPNCEYPAEFIGEGTRLSRAGALSGAMTPGAGEFNNVEISRYDEESGLSFGETVDVSWTMAGWDEAWVQVRSEDQGELVDSVTCTTRGASAYVIDEAVWSLMDSAIDADRTNLYVVVQNTDAATSDDGEAIEVITRVVHAAVVR